jgi:hypothetical protein
MSEFLIVCPGCSRHVWAKESACPFCAEGLSSVARVAPSLPTRRLPRAALFALGATLASGVQVACGGEDDGGVAPATGGMVGSSGGSNATGGVGGAVATGGGQALGGTGGGLATGGAMAAGGTGGVLITPLYGGIFPPPEGGAGGEVNGGAGGEAGNAGSGGDFAVPPYGASPAPGDD